MKENGQNQGRRILKYFQLLFMLASFLFIYFLISKNYGAIQNSGIKIKYGYMLVALVFSVISALINVFSVNLVLMLENINIKFWLLLETLSKTNLYRYIPGGIWNHLGLMMMIKSKTDLSVKTISKVQVLNLGINVWTAFWFVGFLLTLPYSILYLTAYLLTILVLNPGLQTVQKFWALVFKKQKLHFNYISNKSALIIFITNILFWAFAGFAFATFLKGISLVTYGSLFKFLYVKSTFIVASVLGFLFIPAPGGLGIREFVLAYLMERVGILLALGVSVSVLFRIFIIFRDLVFYILVFCYRRIFFNYDIE
jgi:glycosyltransferase 2 family protein